MRTKHVATQLLAILAVSLLVAACGGKADRPPVVTGTERTPPPATTTIPTTTAPVMDDIDDGRNDVLLMNEEDPLGIFETPLDVLNDEMNNPFADIRFDFDSAALSSEARATLDGHAETLRTYGTMTILIEGHCDERGTVEYNLALGERRAVSVYNYLVSLGINASRLKTISYGKEFPLDPGHNEGAWARNRRGHFEITAK